MSRNPRVAYYFDPDVGCFSYGFGHVMKPHRIQMTHSLVHAYKMLPKLDYLRPRRATAEEMTRFHSDDYVHFLENLTPDLADRLKDNPYLGGNDNPPYEGAFEFCSLSAGGSLSAAQRIVTGAADIAINWAGGLHHAKKTGSWGFCYINDIVLAILDLLRIFPRVLYVDIDCHHGDGVEEAFYSTDRVLTCSLHKFGDFFPGSGCLEDRGVGKGYGYAINVPFRQGLCDESFKSVFEPLMHKILDRFQPSAVVLQCGTDSIAGDRLGQYNVSIEGHADCVRFFKKIGLPLMLLGGGGYTPKNVSRAWAYETACALGIDQELDRNLPYNRYFEWFGPEYRLIPPVYNADDANLVEGYLDRLRTTVVGYANEIPIAPSVQMQDVPRHGVADELGLKKRPKDDGEDDEERVGAKRPYDEFDRRIQELAHQFHTSESSESDSEMDEEDETDDVSDQQSHSSQSTSSFVRGTIPLRAPGLFFQSSRSTTTKPTPPPVKRKFFRSEIRFRARGEVEFAIQDVMRYGVCDPVGFDLGYEDGSDRPPLADVEDDEGMEVDEETDSEDDED